MSDETVGQIIGEIIYPTAEDNFREIARQLNELHKRIELIEHNITIEVREETLIGKMTLYEYNKHNSNAKPNHNSHE
jgi:hypothetical protein